jgi:K+-transporting ATPase A subunit
MIGQVPEYLEKNIGSLEMKMTVIITLISGAIVLLLLDTALALPIDEEKALEGKLTVHLGLFYMY